MQKTLPQFGKWLSLCVMGLFFQQQVQAQAITENFNDLSTLTDWSVLNNSTSASTNSTWSMGDPNVFAAYSLPDSSYLSANYTATTVATATGGTISDWLFTPNRTFNNGDIVRFYTKTDGGYADRLQVRLSTAGTSTNVGTTATSVGDFTTLLLDINPTLVVAPTAGAYPETWTQYTVTISGLAGPTSGRIAFRYFVTDGGSGGNNSNYIGLDNYEYIPAAAVSNDLAVNSHNGEYTFIPRSQRTTMSLTANVGNLGAAANATLTARIFSSSNNFATPVSTVSSAATSLASGANSNLTAGTYFPPDTGIYVVQYIVSGGAGFNDANRNNDTLEYIFAVTDSTFGRDNEDYQQTIGLASTTTVAEIGTSYTITTQANLTSVEAALLLANPGDSFRLMVRPIIGGLPSTTASYTSPYFIVTAAQTGGQIITLPINMTLNPGQYYVGVEKALTMDTFRFFNTPEIFTPGTSFYRTGTTSAFADLAGISTEQIGLRINLNTVCALTTTASSTTATCNGANGTATATPSNGTAPYTYMWTGGRTTATATGLTSAAYNVTVTDAAGCVATTSVTVGNFNATITSSISAVNAGCSGTGAVNLSAPTGGTAPYTYMWNNNATTQNLSGVAAGSYMVTIMDANGCRANYSTTVTNNAITLTGTPSSTNTSCGASTGTASINISNGVAPYTYMWNNGGNSQTINNLAAGSYSVTATDANGCRGFFSNIAVGNANGPTAAVGTVNNVTCAGGSNGSISLNISGGQTPYSVMWNNGQTATTASNLMAGNYSATVTDANNCVFTVSQTNVTQPSALTVSATGSNPACAGDNNGIANATNVSGGTPGYSYMWSNGANGQSISGLVAGTYTVSVVDANGCTNSANVNLTDPSSINLGNPTIVNAACNGVNNGSIFLNSVSGGSQPYSFAWSNGATTQNISGISAGGYIVTVTDDNGCMIHNGSNPIIVNSGASPSVAVSKTDVTVAGGNNGTANATVSGGNAPFTYMWSNGATTANISGLVAGSYTVTVTDANGCQGVQSVTIADGGVSVQDLEGGSMSLFPNPNNGNFNLDIRLDAAQDIQVRLVDVQGRTLKQVSFGQTNRLQHAFNYSELSAGVYMLHIQVGAEQRVERIVVSK